MLEDFVDEIDYAESPRKQLDQSLDGKEKEDPINLKELFI